MKRSVLIGSLAGFAVAAVILAIYRGGGSGQTPAGPVLSDCDGMLDRLVIHYLPEASGKVSKPFQDFFRQLPGGITVYVVCRDRAAIEDLREKLGPVACSFVPIVADHPMTGWSRDRWLAASPATEGEPVCITCPRGENLAETWPARKGDEQVASDIARALPGLVRAERSNLYFDAGDFAADDKVAFVTPAVSARNIQHTVTTEAELLDALAKLTGRKVILMRTAPEHHAGMFMAPIGGGRVIVSDPSAGKELFQRDFAAYQASSRPAGTASQNSTQPAGPAMPAFISKGVDFSPQIQELYDAVARQCSQAGYEVIRIPHVPGLASKAYITYVNVIMDNRDGRRIVYMPVYSSLPSLNSAAEEVWRKAGFEVRRIDCTECCCDFGTIHCLVNVLTRK